jgi:hypothetical protein
LELVLTEQQQKQMELVVDFLLLVHGLKFGAVAAVETLLMVVEEEAVAVVELEQELTQQVQPQELVELVILQEQQ